MSKEEPFEQLSELSKLTAGMTRRTAEYLAETTSGFLGDTAKSWTELSNIKKMEDIVGAQARIATEMSNKFMQSSQKALNVWHENSNDIHKFIEHYAHSMNIMDPMSTMNPMKANNVERKG